MSALLLGRSFYVPVDQSSKLVLLALADHANDDGNAARPGLARLEVKTGLSRRTVQRALAHLEEHGVITACGYRSGGAGRATHWTLNVALIRLWADLYSDDPAAYQATVETVSESHPSDQKGVICDIKGCHLRHKTVSPVTPQPSGTIKNQEETVSESHPLPAGGIVAEFHRRIGLEEATR